MTGIKASGTLPIVAIVGRTNVGKSTLFNRLTQSRQAITDDTEHTTRDANYGVVSWGKHRFWLVDTAGLAAARGEIEAQVRDQIDQAATSADALVVVVDAGVTVTEEDQRAVRFALKTGKPVILAVNKADTTKNRISDEFRRLGVKEVIAVSSVHGSGSGDLLDAVISHIKPGASEPPEAGYSIGLVGRPNVGKSSILNSLLGKQQALVHAQAGTTRDTATGRLNYHQQPVEILDTAGLRRRGKIERGVEKFSALRTLSAINDSDICVLVMEATEPAVAGDQHIAGLVDEAGKGLILAVNKWDMLEKDDTTQPRVTKLIEREFQFAWWAPLVLTSATTGHNITKILELAAEIDTRRKQKISTPKLNKTIEALVAKHPPAGMKGRQPKIKYATQTGTEPPTFTLFASYPELIHFSYKRYLENGLREAYDFTGTPIVLEFRGKRG